MKRVEKGWGHELWIVNKPQYCGKLLFLREGKRCSWHYHLLKDETLYVQSGRVRVLFSSEGDLETARERVLDPGQNFHVPVGTVHQLVALLDSEVFEFSTQHFDSDSHRVIRGD